MTNLVEGLAVDGAILKQGDQIVTSDSNSVYITTNGFADRVIALGEQMDVMGSLHIYTSEKRLEKIAIDQLYNLSST